MQQEKKGSEKQYQSDKENLRKKHDEGKRNYILVPDIFEHKVSDDGKAYLEISIKNRKRVTKVLFKVGENGVDQFWMDFVAEQDRESISNEIDASRLSSWDYSNADAADNGAAYIHSHAAIPEKSVHDLAFSKGRELTPLESVVRGIVDGCTEKQKFVFELRCNRQHPVAFNVIAELFEERFGSPISDEGVRKLYAKVESKVCAALGVPYPKKRDRNKGD